MTKRQEIRMLASEWGVTPRQVYRRLSGECLAKRPGPAVRVDKEAFLDAFDRYEAHVISAVEAARQIGKHVRTWHRYVQAHRKGVLFG